MGSQVLRGVTTDWVRKVSPYKITWTSIAELELKWMCRGYLLFMLSLKICCMFSFWTISLMQRLLVREGRAPIQCEVQHFVQRSFPSPPFYKQVWLSYYKYIPWGKGDSRTENYLHLLKAEALRYWRRRPRWWEKVELHNWSVTSNSQKRGP